MAWSFGDGFDLYAVPADASSSYWDNVITAGSLGTGRFAGSRGMIINATSSFIKSSGVNDAVHHLVIAYDQTQNITGSSNGVYLQLTDGTTAQCSVVFRSDGTILLTSGISSGATLATYASAFTARDTWYSFEFEIVINNTTGSFTVRKNGNTVNDFTATGLNTRGGTANNYANKLQLGVQTGVSTVVDDLFWRSDAAAVPWMGDIRCYTRMPASDQSVQFARSAGATNASCVDEAQQNALADYVYDSTPGHADFYGIGSIPSTPVSTIAVTTRGYMQKSDAGTRTAAAQLKSGATTVASPTVTLTTSGWQWAWRTDAADPATGAAWTALGVNNAQVGPLVVA